MVVTKATRISIFHSSLSWNRRQHNNADALSRRPCQQCGSTANDQVTSVAAVTTPSTIYLGAYSRQELHQAQLDDPTVGPLLVSKEANERPASTPAASPEYRRLCQLWDQLIIKDGILYRIFMAPDDNQNWLQLIVPRKL